MDLRERGLTGAERHPWEQARFAFFADVMDRHGLGRGAATLVDVGAGDAWFASALAARHAGLSVICVDAHYDDDAITSLARDRVKLRRDLPRAKADFVTLLDVAEHVDDDVGFVRDIVETCLGPTGKVVFSVPAYQALWSAHDDALGHRRRYDRRSALALLDAGGLRVLEHGGLFSSLLLPRALGVARERILGAPRDALQSTWRGGHLLTTSIARALALDNALTSAVQRRGIFVPGLSLWAVAERR